MHTSVAKKLFAVGTALATVLGTFVPMAVLAAPHAAGTNVKSSDGTIWMITSEGTRRAYTSAGAFLSYGFNSFASVVDANSDDLALPAGSFIPPQDGKIICSDRGADKGTCYLITSAQKGGFTSAAVFTGLGFSFSRATYGDVSWMSSTSNIDNTTMAHRPGVLVNNNGTVQLVGGSGLLGIPDIATFNSWGYSFADVVPANTADKAMTQTGVMAARVAGQLSPSFTTTPGQPQPSGPFTVSLASDSPVAGTLVTSQVGADLAKFVFSGNGTITGVTLKRTGVSADTTLDKVYLYDGATRLTDAASVTNNGVISFANGAGLFSVSGSRTITVKADIAANTSGQTVGVQLTGYTAGGSAVAASVFGNTMNIASATNLAAVSFGAVTPATSTTNTATDLVNDLVVWQSTLTVSNHDVALSRFALREIGSINNSDIGSFRLLVDGQQVATGSSIDANGYVTFSVSPSKTLTTGSHTFKVLANVMAGADRTFQFSLRNLADVGLIDTTYNVGVGVTNTMPLLANTFKVNSAATSGVTIQKASDSATGNVNLSANDMSLGKWSMNTYGESIKIDTLKAAVYASTSSSTAGVTLRNVRLLINGSQYGSSVNLASGTTGNTFTVNYTLQPGTPVTVELRSDIYDPVTSSRLAAGDKITARILAGSSNGSGVTSGNTVSVPSADVAANTLTVVSGSLSLAKQANYSNQTTVLPQTAYKLGSFIASGNSSEDINVDTISVDFTDNATSTNNVYIVWNGTRLSNTKATVGLTGNTWSVNQTLAKNTTATIEVYGDVSSNATGSIRADMTVSGTTAGSSNSVSQTAQGQTITVTGSGTYSVALDAATPIAALVAGNQTRTVAAYRFTATNDTMTITDLTLTFASSTPSTVSQVNLKDGSTTYTPSTITSTTRVFSGMNIVVPANSNKTVTVEMVLGTVGTGAGTSGENIKVYISSLTANGSGTSGVTVTGTGVSSMSNNTYVVKSVPTVSNLTLPNTTLAAGTQTIYKYSVSSNGTGIVSWKTVKFTVATSSGITLASPSLVDADTNTAVSNVTCSFSGTVITCTSTTDQEVSGAKNYALKATLGGVGSSGSISTNIAASGDTTTATSSNSTFMWSDESAVGHTVNTADWYGDYLVKNIPTDSLTMSK